jgi:hypothetical protein
MLGILIKVTTNVWAREINFFPTISDAGISLAIPSHQNRRSLPRARLTPQQKLKATLYSCTMGKHSDFYIWSIHRGTDDLKLPRLTLKLLLEIRPSFLTILSFQGPVSGQPEKLFPKVIDVEFESQES